MDASLFPVNLYTISLFLSQCTGSQTSVEGSDYSSNKITTHNQAVLVDEHVFHHRKCCLCLHLPAASSACNPPSRGDPVSDRRSNPPGELAMLLAL